MSDKIPTAVSEIKLVYISRVRAADRPFIASSEAAYRILKANWSDQIALREEFNVLLLDRANRVMSMYPVARGGI